MTRFADVHIRLTDDARVRQIREDEARRVERQFAPIKTALAANRAAMAAASKTALAWA